MKINSPYFPSLESKMNYVRRKEEYAAIEKH